MSNASKNNQFVFKAKTKAGFGLKILSEYLSNLLKFPPFAVNERGIFVRGMDQHGEVLVDVEMPRENFTIFKCPKPIHFSVNANHFYRLLKTIKKKDTVSLFIQEQRPMQLGICVEQGEERERGITTFIQISWVQPAEIELPDGYEQPIVETSKRFQRLKMLHPIGPELKATVIGGRTVMFFVNGKNLYSREVTLGEDPDDDEVEEEGSSYTLTYTTSHITQLTKCAGQSGNIQIFHHEELPLFIKMKIDTLATVAVYIKSHELIEQLENDPEEEGDEPEETDAADTSPTASKAQVQLVDGEGEPSEEEPEDGKEEEETVGKEEAESSEGEDATDDETEPS